LRLYVHLANNDSAMVPRETRSVGKLEDHKHWWEHDAVILMMVAALITPGVLRRAGRMEEFSMPGNGMSCPMNAQALKSLPSLSRIDLSNNRMGGK